jgi:hypothetical protein
MKKLFAHSINSVMNLWGTQHITIGFIYEYRRCISMLPAFLFVSSFSLIASNCLLTKKGGSMK